MFVKWFYNLLIICNNVLFFDVIWGFWLFFLIDVSNKYGDFGGGGYDVCSVDIEV